MSAHGHSAYVEGCFRCDLLRDEAEGDLAAAAREQSAPDHAPTRA